MKYLIVNADDFGWCAGVNRRIVEAHRRGIVTSASLMVGMPGSEEAARQAREWPELSVGLHVRFDEGRNEPATYFTDTATCQESLNAQFIRFTELMGRPPTHLDSHRNVHILPGLLPHFEETAERCGIPLRRYPRVRHISRFYGQWAGEHHPEEVSVPALIQILATDVGDGVTELGCHSGCADPALVSSYRRLARRSRRSRRSSTAIWSQPRTAARSGIRRPCGPYWRRPDRKPPRTVVASMGNP